MIQTYQALRLNILLLLIIMNLRVKYYMQGLKRGQLISKMFPISKKHNLTTNHATSATKGELKVQHDKKVKSEAFGLGHFLGKIDFEDDGFQNYLVFQPAYRYLKRFLMAIVFLHGKLKRCLM